MLLLITTWGDYLLNNLSRIDVYKTKELRTWKIYITLDSHKHLLYGFESERDAFIFVDQLRNLIRDNIVKGPMDAAHLLVLDNLCKAALQVVEDEGMVE